MRQVPAGWSAATRAIGPALGRTSAAPSYTLAHAGLTGAVAA